MSDFFIGQLLVLLALLPVLLRVYIKALQELEGIPLLSLVAVAVCLGTAASGLRLLFFPFFAFALIIFFSQIRRIVSMAKGLLLPAFFEAGTKAISAFGIAIFAILAAFSVYFQPEFSYKPERAVSVKTEKGSLSAGFRYRFHVFSQEEPSAAADNIRSVLLYFPSFPAGRSGRDTLLTMAAERGIDALAANWSGKGLYSSATMNPEALRDLRQIAYAAWQASRQAGTEAQYVTEFEQAQSGVMQTVILDTARFAFERSIQENPGSSVRLFAVAEGYACAPLAAVVAAKPNLFAGAVYLISEEGLNNFRAPEAGCFWQRGLGGAIPNSAENFSQIVITSGRAGELDFGEMTAEDPALATLLGFERDRGRELARLVAERVLSWIEARK